MPGGISAPCITPSDQIIDSSTLIEMKCETPGVEIFYTLNGTKPLPFQTNGERFTLKYRKPIALDSGRRVIKAVAVSRRNAAAAPSVIRTKFVEVVDYRSGSDSESSSSSSGGGLSGAESVDSMDTRRHSPVKTHHHRDSRRTAAAATKNASTRSAKDRRHGGSVGAAAATSRGKKTAKSSLKKSVRRRGRSRSQSYDSATSEGSLSLSSDGISDVGRHTGRETWREAMLNPPHISSMDAAVAQGRLLPKDGYSVTQDRQGGRGRRRGKQPRDNRELSVSPGPEAGGVRADTHCLICSAARPKDPSAEFCEYCGSPLTPLTNTLRGGAPKPKTRSQPQPLPPPQQQQGLQQQQQQQQHSTLLQPQQTMYAGGINPMQQSMMQHTQHQQQQQQQAYSNMTQQNIGLQTAGAGGADMWAPSQQQQQQQQQYVGTGGWIPPAQQQPLHTYGGGLTELAHPPMDANALTLQAPAPGQEAMWQHQHGGFWAAASAAAGETLGETRETLLMEEEEETKQRKGASVGGGGGPRHGARAAHAGTQTTGLYFPSTAQMSRNRNKARGRDHAPAAGMISPGQGYWRAQLDHLGHHLKGYARDNPAFQAAVGQPIMGGVRAARIEENGDAIVFTVVLERKDPPEEATVTDGEEGGEETSKKSRRHGKRHGKKSSDALVKQLRAEQDKSSARARASKKVATATAGGLSTSKATATPSAAQALAGTKQLEITQSKKHPSKNRSATSGGPPRHKELDNATKMLIAELGAGGNGNEDVVLGLIDEGADVNALTSRREHILYLAALHGRAAAIPLLLDAQSKVNARSFHGETALHAAVRANDASMEIIDVLVSAGADPTLLSQAGLAPLALAESLHKRQLVKFIAGRLGKALLARAGSSGL